jgi:N6-adenosine-specific RNA methylase IME4
VAKRSSDEGVAFCWVKLNKGSEGYFTGLGYWTRANLELCLLATRGKPPRKTKDLRRLVVEPRREHSRKPDCVHNRRAVHLQCQHCCHYQMNDS